MSKEKLISFIADNKDAFSILAKKIRKAKSIDNVDDIVDLKANKKAVQIIVSWLDEIFTEITSEEIDSTLEEEPIFTMNKTPEKEF